MLDLSWLIFFLIFMQTHLEAGSLHFTTRQSEIIAQPASESLPRSVTQYEICDGQLDFERRSRKMHLRMDCVNYDDQGSPWGHQAREYLIRPDLKSVFYLDRKAQKYYRNALTDLDLLLKEYATEDSQSGYINADQAYQIRQLKGDTRLLEIQDSKTGLKSLVHLQTDHFDYRIKAWWVKGSPQAKDFELPESMTVE